MKKLLVIGGGKWQVPIVKKAKELGCEVVCTNLYEDSPAFEFADYSYVSNVLDKEKNLEIAKKHSIDAAITDQSDIAVNTVAYVNEKLGLKGAGTEIANLFTNKYKMRESLKVEGLHHPQYKLCENIKELKEFFNIVNKSIIIKPIDSQSSRGVRIINNIEDIEEAYDYTMSHCRKNIFIAEEFIGGIELTVEGYKFKNGKHYTFAVSKKSYFKSITGVADSLQYQPIFKEFDIDEIKTINDKLFVDVPFAITHVEYKYYDGRFYLIEATIRGGGTKVSSILIPAVSGYDVNSFLVQDALGENIEFIKNDYKNKYAILKFFSFTGGAVKEISGIDKIVKNSNVLDFELEFSIGDKLLPPTDDRSRVGYFIVKADSLEELNQILNYVEKTVQVKFEE
jgi:biotin carboxylase